MSEAVKSKADPMNNSGRYALIAAAAIATFSIGYAIAHGDGQGEASGVLTQAIAAETMANADLANAIFELEARLKTDPEDEEGWALLGFSYFQIRRYKEAALAYERATALNPALARYHSARGEALIMADQDGLLEERWNLILPTPGHAISKGYAKILPEIIRAHSTTGSRYSKKHPLMHLGKPVCAN